jgi:hypothetical protein
LTGRVPPDDFAFAVPVGVAGLAGGGGGGGTAVSAVFAGGEL